MHEIPRQYLRGADVAPPRTLLDVLAGSVDLHPDAPCLDDGERVLTYAQVWAEITTTARWMHDQGVGVGDRVGIHMPSGSVDLYLAILSTLAAGAAYVPVDVDDPAERAVAHPGAEHLGELGAQGQGGVLEVVGEHGREGRGVPGAQGRHERR